MGGMHRYVVLFLVLGAAACKRSDERGATDRTAEPLASAPSAGLQAEPAAPARAAVSAPAGDPPPDGKYERVVVDGITVPMIQVMNGGTVILVDTDGKKPRTWEEQYKKKRATLLTGQLDLHKTNTNANDTFEDDAIDKEGLWVIDAKGNVIRH